MTIDIPEQIISQTLVGVIAVLAVLGVGTLLTYLLQGIAGAYPFTRLGLVIALAPLSLFNVLDDHIHNALLLYAMIAILIGMILDGVRYMLPDGNNPHADPPEEKQEEETADTGSGGIVWEKAE